MCSYLDSILSRQNSTHTISELYEGINAIESLVWNCLFFLTDQISSLEFSL